MKSKNIIMISFAIAAIAISALTFNYGTGSLLFAFMVFVAGAMIGQAAQSSKVEKGIIRQPKEITQDQRGIANYIRDLGDKMGTRPIDVLSLQKIMFLAQKRSKIDCDVPLINVEARAGVTGPFYTIVNKELSAWGAEARIRDPYFDMPFAPERLSLRQHLILMNTIEEFMKKSFIQASDEISKDPDFLKAKEAGYGHIIQMKDWAKK